MSLIVPHTLWLECRSEWSVVRERNTWVTVFTEDAADIQFSWRFIGTELKVTFLTSLRLWFIAVYFQFQWVVHFNIYSCDEQKYTYTQLKLTCLQPIEWRILHFFGIIRFPKWTALLQSAIHFSSNFDEEVFDISFFRRFHFRGLRKTFWILALFLIPCVGWLITECFLFHWVVRFNTYSCDEQSCTQLFAFSD
jgi:hypothetical protein